jgi:S1-C subfamily serine protease
LDSDGFWADISSSERVDVQRWWRRSVSRWAFGLTTFVLVAAIAFGGWQGFLVWQAQPNVPEVVEKVSKSTFVVYCGNAMGTGVAVDIPKPDGVKTIVLSAAHVFSGCAEASKVDVEYQGRKYQGTLVAKDPEVWKGSDPENRVDLARIDLSAEFPALKPAPQARIGGWAIIIGNPLGRENYATFGIVSAVHEKYYETDAAANEGNSGGPLVDNFGRVLGIVSSGQLKDTAMGDAQDANGMVQVMRLSNACGRLFAAGPGCPFSD